MKFSAHSMTWIMLIIPAVYCIVRDEVSDDYRWTNRIADIVRSGYNYARSLFSQDTEASDQTVTFYCIKMNNPRFTQTYINDPQIHRKLDIEQPMAFIIHGWYDNVDRAWLKETAQEYIRYANTNVCAVNWNVMALNRYSVSAGHTDGVARITTQFVNYLVASGFKLERMTLVGHSMGAHIAGMVGHSTNGKIGQIIGLDPAGPMFTTVSPRPISRRLDETSAQFVQVIHTDKYAIGTAVNLGHQDFFPNDGATPQPGCVVPVVQRGAMGYTRTVCSHFKAVEYFRYSLNPTNQFWGVACHSYEAYEKDECNNNQHELFGVFNSQSARGKFYLKVSATPPFALA